MIRDPSIAAPLAAYDRKKYVWKLLYIFIMGYEVDFGHKQACDLISQQKYSEKQVRRPEPARRLPSMAAAPGAGSTAAAGASHPCLRCPLCSVVAWAFLPLDRIDKGT